MESKWPYSCCFLRYCFLNLFKIASSPLVSSHLTFSPFVSLASMWCILTEVLTDTDKARKKSLFILSEISYFRMIDLSVVVHIFERRMLTSISLDKILLPRCMNWCTNFRRLLLKVEMAPFCTKPENFFMFMLRPMAPTAWYTQGSSNLVWARLFGRRARWSA